MRPRLVAALLVFGVVFLFHQTAHAASCVPVLAGQDKAFGNPYWQSGYYLNDLMHPHPHETYPEVELTWNPHDASDLVGYKVVAEDAYTTDGSLSQSFNTLAKMPLTVTVGKDTRQVRLPNMASQLRTWVVYARFDGGALSDDPIASTTLICGQDVRENRSNDAPYVYVDLVNTDGMTQQPEAIGYSDWTDYGCHYALPDEYARGVDPNSIYGQPAHYPFTGSWNWGFPVVGELVDDSYDVEGLSYLRECLSDKPTAHLAEAWDIEPIRFNPEASDEQATEPPTTPTGLTATASHDSITLTWDDPNDDSITGYVVKRRMRRGGNYGTWGELVADTGSASTTYTDDSVGANARYAYRIKAINEHGVSGVSRRSDWVRIDTP
jgi:hypothetical protein